jgi:hypothetical protein
MTSKTEYEIPSKGISALPVQYFEKVEKICYSKCVKNPLTPLMDLPEKSCLERCAKKFKEAEEFGTETLRYLKYKLVEAQKEEPANPIQRH